MALGGKGCRRKGANGELEACHVLGERFGWKARRTAQMQSARGSGYADIVCDQTPSLFLEVKRQEKLNVPKALATAVAQAGRKCPVVLHRQNRSALGWMITLRLEDLPRLAHAYEAAVNDSMVTPTLPDDNANNRPRRGDDTGGARPVPHR